MTIEPVINSTPINVITSCLEACQEGISWLGHTLVSGFSDYVIPAAEKLGGLAIKFFGDIQNFVQTAPISAVAILCGIVVISVTAFKLADREAMENDVSAKKVFQTFGALTLISAVALASLGAAAVLI